ncbi:MAG: hypothetical protein JW726_14600 [Anaerolineales bacterium]|nr:hypothetical protein [Anaerolineales bacterium]
MIRPDKKTILALLILAALLVGCSESTPLPTGTPAPTATATLAEPEVLITSAPDAQPVAVAYLDAWLIEDYAAMYAILTAVSQDAITVEDFTQRYREVANVAALDGWEYEILSTLINSPRNAQVGYRVTFHSLLVGDFTSEMTMHLSLENGQWRVQWDDALIMSELKGGNYLSMEYRIPARANIYDRNGRALVAQTDAVAIGLDSAAVDPDRQGSLLSELALIADIDTTEVEAQLDAYRPLGSYYIPVADIAADELAPRQGSLTAYSGVLLTPFRTRYYFGEGIAPHVVGYMSYIQEGEAEVYQRLGYRVDERVGRDGLEYYYESALAGKRGGVLYLVGPDGKVLTILAEREAQPAQAVYTTIDYDLQRELQRRNALSVGMLGAIVVLERDSGRVLSMVSSPGYNPNLFEPANLNYSYLINDLYSADLPLLNRAAQGQYPLGSVFKIITMAAGLESGVFTAESEYNCGYFFEELPGHRPNDWTYDHYLEDGRTQASGILTLPEGLMRSCNPWFWHIGLDLFNRGMVKAVSDMARGFGLGSPTGIEIGEEAGVIPDPVEQVDAINLAIGQGSTQVTPLQVAAFIAAVGNGGTLYRPSVIEQIVPPDGTPSYTFSAQVNGTLPVSPENLALIQQAMFSVVTNPRGTAYRTGSFGLNSFVTSTNIPVAGKTGTAESGYGEPHAWFGGYTDAGRENQPDIAVVVVVQYGGEGSEVAAPIFRRVLEIYYGYSLTRYPWEARPGVVATPTAEVTETPTPEAEVTPTP